MLLAIWAQDLQMPQGHHFGYYVAAAIGVGLTLLSGASIEAAP